MDFGREKKDPWRGDPAGQDRPKMAKMRPKMAKMRPKMAKMRPKMAKMRPGSPGQGHGVTGTRDL